MSALPNLDFANPLYTFTANGQSYTATKDCYLLGTMGNTTGGSANVKINNVVIWNRSAGGDYATGETLNIPLTKISSGDTIAVNGASTLGALHVFAEL
jgi:hypothetical protein